MTGLLPTYTKYYIFNTLESLINVWPCVFQKARSYSPKQDKEMFWHQDRKSIKFTF